MKKGLLYILINFSSVVIADWITVEHDFKMCDQVVPSNLAAIHINDDGEIYSASLLVRKLQTISHEPPLTTLNVTMWGCTYDCTFSFMVKINRDDISVSSYTENNNNNYKCHLSNYTMKLIPTPKITYNKEAPNPNHVFPTELTAKYCSQGKHPDAPGVQINQAENVAECIDNLTGNEVGTYAASLQFGSGSSFSPENYPVATYHMINSANKLFNHWDSHHRGYHDALKELSVKMTPDNLKELIPPPPPPRKEKRGLFFFLGIGFVVVAGLLCLGFSYWALSEASVLYAEYGSATDAITTAAGATAREAAEGWASEVAADGEVLAGQSQELAALEDSFETLDQRAMEAAAKYYERRGDENANKILELLNRDNPSTSKKRDTVPMDNIGFFTVNQLNAFFMPTIIENVHESLTGDGQHYPDISSYLSAASEHLQFHFEDTLHNNFFAANKSILASFTVNQRMDEYKFLDSDEDVYNSTKQNTYNNMAAAIISTTLRKFNVEICDPKPSFCGQSCDSGHTYCPTIGDDNCVISASDGQIKELKFLRDTFDICSTNTTKTGWNITHNSNCDINQFQCQ